MQCDCLLATYPPMKMQQGSTEAQCSWFYIATAAGRPEAIQTDTLLLYTFHQLTTNTMINVSSNDFVLNACYIKLYYNMQKVYRNTKFIIYII